MCGTFQFRERPPFRCFFVIVARNDEHYLLPSGRRELDCRKQVRIVRNNNRNIAGIFPGIIQHVNCEIHIGALLFVTPDLNGIGRRACVLHSLAFS